MTHSSKERHRQFLDEDETQTSTKRVSILSAPLANTVSWGSGTEHGPTAIIETSPALESFDDELRQETFLAGIDTLPPITLAGLSTPDACQAISQATDRELSRGRLPVLLGGEHTVTVGAVAACARHYPDLHVVQVDAHLDLRDSYENDPLSHACVMRRLHDLALPFTQVGIRSFSKEEWQLVKDNRWQPFFMERIHREPDWIDQVCDEIRGPVYLTFDVDGLDPAVVPATGTPEPDGLSWLQATALIRAIASRHRIVGLDFVELSPRPELPHATFNVAKLIYRTLGYIFRPLLSGQR
ncbi:MAG: agmatinase [Desulfobulbaceae bacterium]|nr:agmatinase [Desulfobulbaceae bacterium]